MFSLAVYVMQEKFHFLTWIYILEIIVFSFMFLFNLQLIAVGKRADCIVKLFFYFVFCRLDARKLRELIICLFQLRSLARWLKLIKVHFLVSVIALKSRMHIYHHGLSPLYAMQWALKGVALKQGMANYFSGGRPC